MMTAQGATLLKPFGHQVAGRSSIFNFDSTTICKPVSTREHFLYQHFPDRFQQFIPQYRGDIQVYLQEEQDGIVQFYGVPVTKDSNVNPTHLSSDICTTTPTTRNCSASSSQSTPEEEPLPSPAAPLSSSSSSPSITTASYSNSSLISTSIITTTRTATIPTCHSNLSSGECKERETDNAKVNYSALFSSSLSSLSSSSTTTTKSISSSLNSCCNGKKHFDEECCERKSDRLRVVTEQIQVKLPETAEINGVYVNGYSTTTTPINHLDGDLPTTRTSTTSDDNDNDNTPKSSSSSSPSSSSSSSPSSPPERNPWNVKNEIRLRNSMANTGSKTSDNCFILLENVTSDFNRPCILDLKLGSRLYGDDATPAKVEYQTRKSANTTSGLLGLRVCGMQVYHSGSDQITYHDKYYGNSLSVEGFKETLIEFLSNGSRFRDELILPVVSELDELIKCLETMEHYRFFTSSLLIVYDGKGGEKKQVLKTVSPCGDSDSEMDETNVWYNYKESKVHSKSVVVGTSSTQKVGKSSCSVINGCCGEDAYTYTHSDSCLDEHVPCCEDSQTMCSNQEEKATSSDKASSSYSNPNSTFSNGQSSNTLSSMNDSSLVMESNHQALSAGKKKLSGESSHEAPSAGTNSTVSPSESSCENTPITCNTDLSFCTRLRSKIDDNCVRIKMIDFGNVAYKGIPCDKGLYEGPDMDCMKSLINLKSLFLELSSSK